MSVQQQDIKGEHGLVEDWKVVDWRPWKHQNLKREKKPVEGTMIVGRSPVDGKKDRKKDKKYDGEGRIGGE